MSITPGWYKDPGDPTTQRYWDGEGWLGDPIPADAQAPDGPPVVTAPKPAPPATPVTPAAPVTPVTPVTLSPPGRPMSPPPTVNGLPPVPYPYQGPPPAGPGWAPPPGYPPGPMPYPVIAAVGPAPVVHGHPVAGLGTRLVARLIDIAAVLGLNILVTGWFVYRWWMEVQPFFSEYFRRSMARESTSDMVVPEQANSLIIVIVVLVTALWFAYEVPTLANTGQTPGKRLMGIKVVRVESRDQLGFGRAIRRWNLMGLATMLWTCFGIGFLIQFAVSLSPVLNWPLHQGLHDRSAGTVVVQVGKEDEKKEPAK